MRIKLIPAFVVVLSAATTVAAQTKISGTADCAKPDAQHMLEVGDRSGHSLAIAQVKCKWSKPWEMAGIQNKEGVSTASDDVTGDRSRTHGYYVDTMANGDKAFYSYEGPVTLKDGAPQSAEAHWSLIGGTGKLKGIKGKGTCKGKARQDGGLTWECEGEYELPK